MKIPKSRLEDTFSLTLKDFQLDKTQYPAVQDSSELKTMVSAVISELMDSNFEKLLLILYRIDVNEEQVKRVISQDDPEMIADNLAELVINRELEKIETRIRYQ